MIQWHREVQQVGNIVHFPTFNKPGPGVSLRCRAYTIWVVLFRTREECPGWHRYPGAAAQSFQLKGVVRASLM